MKNLFKYILASCLMVFALQSCQDEIDVDGIVNNYGPSILASYPFDGQPIPKGDTTDFYVVLAEVQESPLNSATLSVKDSTGSVIAMATASISGTVDTAWLAFSSFETDSLALGNYTLEVEASDNQGNAASHVINWSVGGALSIRSIGILGNAINGWDEDVNLDYNPETGLYFINDYEVSDGEAKFREDDDWATNWGDAAFPSGTATQDGSNILVNAGTYNISFDPETGAYSFERAFSFTQNVEELYLIGDFNFRDSVRSDYQFTLTESNTWQLTEVLLPADAKFKFFETATFTGRNFGDKEGDGIAEENEAKSICLPMGSLEAFYNVTFNDETLEYTIEFVKLPSIGIIGSATPGGWDADTDMTETGETFTIVTVLKDGELKFRANDDWAVNWGGEVTDLDNFVVSTGGANIPITAGLYKIVFNPMTGEVSITETTVGIIGDATPGGWGEDTDLSIGEGFDLVGTVNLVGGKEAKFREGNDWVIDWGGSAFPEGIAAFKGANISVPEDGNYEITFNPATGAYSFTDADAPLYNSIGIIGDATPGGWGADTDMDKIDDSNYNIITALKAGEMKFRANDAWDFDWGGITIDGGTTTLKGGNIAIPETGAYIIDFNPITGDASFSAATIGVIGSATPGGWDTDTDMSVADDSFDFTVTLDLVAGDLKFRANDAWDIDWGSNDQDGNIQAKGGNIAIAEDGNYNITFNLASKTYSIVKN